jgi:hypothetical protein
VCAFEGYDPEAWACKTSSVPSENEIMSVDQGAQLRQVRTHRQRPGAVRFHHSRCPLSNFTTHGRVPGLRQPALAIAGQQGKSCRHVPKQPVLELWTTWPRPRTLPASPSPLLHRLPPVNLPPPSAAELLCSARFYAIASSYSAIPFFASLVPHAQSGRLLALSIVFTRLFSHIHPRPRSPVSWRSAQLGGGGGSTTGPPSPEKPPKSRPFLGRPAGLRPLEGSRTSGVIYIRLTSDLNEESFRCLP